MRKVQNLDMGAMICHEAIYRSLQILKKQKINSDFWKVRWKGLSIDVKPFLPMASICLHRFDIAKSLMGDVTTSLVFRPLLQQYETMEFNKQLQLQLGDEMYYVLSSLQFTCKEHHMPACVLSILLNEDVHPNFYRKLPSIFLEDLVYTSASGDIIDRRVEMHESGICNTQAFSYHLCCLWALQLNPMIQKTINDFVKKSSLLKALEEECPETSLHYRYLVGEISAEELYTKYTALNEISPKEIEYTYLTGIDRDFEYNSDKHIAIRNAMDNNPEIEQYCMGYLGFALGTCSTYGNLEKDYKELCTEYNKAKEEADSSTDTAERLKTENARLNNKIKALKEDVNNLSKRLEESKPAKDERDDKIEQLKREIKELENGKRIAEKSLAEVKSENKTLIKANKSLLSAIAKFEELNEDVEEEQEQPDTVGFSLEEAVNALKGKRICLLGGSVATDSLCKKAETYGLYFDAYEDLGTYDVAKADIVCVCAYRCTHRVFYKAVSQLGGKDKLIFFKGSNFELLIKQLWDKITSIDV